MLILKMSSLYRLKFIFGLMCFLLGSADPTILVFKRWCPRSISMIMLLLWHTSPLMKPVLFNRKLWEDYFILCLVFCFMIDTYEEFWKFDRNNYFWLQNPYFYRIVPTWLCQEFSHYFISLAKMCSIQQ